MLDICVCKVWSCEKPQASLWCLICCRFASNLICELAYFRNPATNFAWCIERSRGGERNALNFTLNGHNTLFDGSSCRCSINKCLKVFIVVGVAIAIRWISSTTAKKPTKHSVCSRSVLSSPLSLSFPHQSSSRTIRSVSLGSYKLLNNCTVRNYSRFTFYHHHSVILCIFIVNFPNK